MPWETADTYWAIGAAVFWIAALAVMFIAAKRAPTCRCGRRDCGGGCL